MNQVLLLKAQAVWFRKSLRNYLVSEAQFVVSEGLVRNVMHLVSEKGAEVVGSEKRRSEQVGVQSGMKQLVSEIPIPTKEDALAAVWK